MLSKTRKLIIERAVRRGIKVLDQAKPDWYKRGVINLRQLNMKSCHVCILGQAYKPEETWGNGYATGLRELGMLAREGKIKLPRGVNPDDIDPDSIGCSTNFPENEAWNYLRDVWKSEIRARRKARRAVAA